MPQPRDFLNHQEQFGVTDPPDWKAVSHAAWPDFEAAKLQHEVARKIREQMRRLDMDTDQVAAQVVISAEQLRRLLRGESLMSPRRMYQLARAVALDITFTVEPTE
jgi:hypothetical protein